MKKLFAPTVSAVADALEVCSLVSSGSSHTDAYRIIAERREVPEQTIADNCTTSIGLTTKEFLRLIKKNKLTEYLKKQFSERKS